MDTNDIIYIGSVEFPTIVFDRETIETISCENKVDIVGNELSSDVLEFSVMFDDTNNALRNLEYGTDVFYYSNENLIGKYFFTSFSRTGTKRYTLYCTSMVGIIEKENFYGNFYNNVDFKDVLTDVLFTSSTTLDKWIVYAITRDNTTSPYHGTPSYRIYGSGVDAKYWKFKMQTEFLVQEPLEFISNPSALTSDTYYVCGYNGSPRYLVSVQARRATTSSSPYWVVIAYYGGRSYTFGSGTPLYGTGTRFFVEVDPLAKKVQLKAKYIKYDDPTVTGEETASITMTIDPPTSATIDLGYAFGCGNYSESTYLNHVYYAYRLYDENGTLVLNAAAIQKNSSGNQWYIVNTCNGVEAATTSFYTPLAYGDPIGYAGGIARFFRDIELSQNIQYAEGIDTLDVYGWIDKCTRREALHQLLFAENVSMLKTADGKILFTSIANGESSEIDEQNCYDDSEERDIEKAKQVFVTEHAYEQVNTSVKIFDNTNSPAVSGQYLAVFDRAPIYGTPVGNGITILAYNSNVAIVTGRGTITGTVYNDSQTINSFINTSVADGADVSISNVGLITAVNSDNVMNRLKAYYCSSAKEVTNSLIYDGEKCGVKYRFKTLYQDINEGFLSRLSARVSSFVKATCMWVTGYIPPKAGGYSAFVAKIAGESFTIPEDVRTQPYPNIRIVVIGKGSPGTAGSAGEDGEPVEEAEFAPGGQGGAGGAPGLGGQGGLIYTITLDATNINRIDVSASGTNVLAKTYNNGGSLINTYSSASGNRNDNGHINILNGSIYGRRGADGVPGGKGGMGGGAPRAGGGYPESGQDVESYIGGHTAWKEEAQYGEEYVTSYYSGGGGAAYGANGGNSIVTGVENLDTFVTGGAGANAGAARVVYPEYGCGGSGGNGGGGGGGAGTRVHRIYHHGTETVYTYAQEPGLGGAGGAGADGIQGCVIIYY